MTEGEVLKNPRARFEDIYNRNRPPWDIGEPQPAFVRAADEVEGTVLDVGCGTGENVLFFADRGHEALGIDFLEAPIYAAKQKAIQRGSNASFEVQDALALEKLGHTFDTILDCGLFHVFSDDDRLKYVDSLASAIESSGKLFLLCFSENEPEGQGPRRVTQEEIHESFSGGWQVESIEPARFKTRTDIEGISFSEGGPHAWFAKIRWKL